MFVAVAIAYTLSSAIYLAYVLGGRDSLARWAQGTLALAFVLHLAEIGSLCLVGRHPVQTTSQVLSLASWLTTGAFLIASMRFRMRITAVGALIAPATVILLLGAHWAPSTVAWTESTSRHLGEVHITLATMGLAAFTLAAASSALFLLTESQLKHGHFGALFHRAPPLEVLDGLVHRAVRMGFPIFTLGLILGALWAAERGNSTMRPEYVVSLTAWCAFALLLVARFTAGWRGKRAAILTLLGFATSVMVVAMYLLRTRP